MPIYEIENPETGQILELEGATPPSDAEIDRIFDAYKKDPTFLEKVRDNLPIIMGGTAGALGLPIGLAPIFGAAGAAGGYIVKDILTPKNKNRSKEQIKKESGETLNKSITGVATAATAFDLAQGLLGSKGSISGKITRPKETVGKYRDEQARLNPGRGVKKSDFIQSIITKTDPLKEKTGYLKPISNFQSQLEAKYSNRPAYLSTSDMLGMKSTSNQGGFSNGNLRSNAAGSFDRATGDVLRSSIANNSKKVSNADKVLSFLYKVPKTVSKAGNVATKAASTIGLLKLLGL